MSNEEWRPAPGAPGYEVSNLGNVRCWRQTGGGVRREPKPLKQSPRRGYLRINASVDGATHPRAVHHMVLEAFVGPRPAGTECRHLNGNPTDNRISNLTWDTKAHNLADREQHGTLAKGERNGSSKLTQEQVEDMRRRHAAGESVYAIAKRVGIHRKTAGQIVRNELWRTP